MALIELHVLSHWYDGAAGEHARALHDVSLSIEEGEFVCLTGPSGSGKSTLLHLLGGLIKPTGGRYNLAGQEVSGLSSDALALLRRRVFGFVFQSFNLVHTATAVENVEMPGGYAGLKRAARRKRAQMLLARVGLENHFERLPSELSGGQQQRVAIARALMNGGRVILADEPTQALDRENASRVLETLEELAERGHTVVLATHDRDIASCSPRCIELLNGRLIGDTSKDRTPTKNAAETLPNNPMEGETPDAMRLGLQSLGGRIRRGKRLGLILPALGVALGAWVGGLALLLGDGIYARVVQAVNDMGMETLTVMRSGKTGLDGSFKWLTRNDAVAIRDEITGVRAVSPAKFWSKMQIRRGDVAVELSAVGVVDRGTKEGRGAVGYRLAAGDSITPRDDEMLERVAVLDKVARDRLFPLGADPVGKEIQVNGTPFRVKGIYQYRTGMLSDAPDDEVKRQEDILNSSVYLPFRTSYALFAEDDRVFWIYVFLENPDKLFKVGMAIRELGIRRYGEDVYFVEHWGEQYQDAKSQRESLQLGLGGVAGIVLLAVNSGVVTIMLAAIRTRRREIGIRIAVGARRRDIFLQFLSEALIISAAGGLLGSLLTLASIPLLNYLGYPPGIPEFLWVPLAISLLVGLVFGIAPSRRAARLSPVTALAPE